MIDHPMRFKPEMIRALLDGRKTQTRRERYMNPYSVGDRLWVKEAWQALAEYDHLKPSEIPVGSDLIYNEDRPNFPWSSRKRSSLFMPKWASRITLVITDVRVQRLNDISDADALAEGFPSSATGDYCDYREWYHDLWEFINGPNSWEDNPFVAAYTFTVRLLNIGDAT